MKKTSKIIVALLILLTILSISISSFAGEVLDPKTLQGTAPKNQDTLIGFGNGIIGVIQTVGAVVAVVILLVLGIKYMMGSAEEKADYKKSMIPYIVGAILLFAATTVGGMIWDLATSLNSTTSSATGGGKTGTIIQQK